MLEARRTVGALTHFPLLMEKEMKNRGKVHTFSWKHGEGEIQSLGAMLGPVSFQTKGGKIVQPFEIAHWENTATDKLTKLPGLMHSLRGEWPCVPFGMPETTTDLPVRWLDGLNEHGTTFETEPHGHSSNHHWTLISHEGSSVTMAIDYPINHPIQTLSRTVTGDAAASAIDLRLTVEARSTVDLPIGLHPVFRLPSKAQQAEILFSGNPRAHTFPIDPISGVSRLQPDQSDVLLTKLSLQDGTLVDATLHPFPFITEELILVTGHEGLVTINNRQEGYATTVKWDATVFPSCLMWVSNRGRTGFPWDKQFCAIGIEPVSAAFDLGELHSRNSRNPLASNGIKCTEKFTAQTPWTTDYRISVFDIERSVSV